MPTPTDVMGSGTAAGALGYLDFLAARRHVPAGAARAVRVAFVKVLQAVEGEGWEKADVREIDIHAHMRRFGDLTRGSYTDKSLADYKSRLKKARAWYLEFLADPEWVPTVKARKVHAKRTDGHRGRDERARLVPYHFPLSSGGLATLCLPPTLRAEDAGRLVRFVGALAVEAPAAGKR